jgi:hypothetical protein
LRYVKKGMHKGIAAWFVVCAAFLSTADAAASDNSSQDVYRSPDKWLCRPGRQDICATGQDSTSIAKDGSLLRENWQPDPAAPIDCFYVYPTISEERAGNSGLIPGPGEKRAVEFQFARFAAICRPFAPMYRQITLAGLSSVMTGKPLPMDSNIGYSDVLAAWNDYLKYDNQGRGVVLIGHSQGSRVLVELMRREIDGKPMHSRLVSALILGWNIDVPRDADAGGTFKQLPLCQSADQTGCVITYVSFRATTPPPLNARFGRTNTPNMIVACTDPVALSGEELRAYLPVRTNLLGQVSGQDDWKKMAETVPTPFVSLPGLLSAACVSNGDASYLAISMNANPQDTRPNNVPGDILVGGRVRDDWGLHLIDMNLDMGNLLDVVSRQSAAFIAARLRNPGQN